MFCNKKEAFQSPKTLLFLIFLAFSAETSNLKDFVLLKGQNLFRRGYLVVYKSFLALVD